MEEKLLSLDVIVPTFNRAPLLAKTLTSLLAAPRPPGLSVKITVVDNNSKDNTRALVSEYQADSAGQIAYIFEPLQGRCHAINAGITNTDGDLIGFIDDDEEIDSHWFTVVHATFMRGNIDFIGGPVSPNWGITPPKWLPREYCGVIGWIEHSDQEMPYDKHYPGILMGGNAVIARRVIDRVGLYRTWLGRTDKGLLAGEDEEMYARLLAAGARGYYIPELIIRHYIPAERLTKGYFRRWCLWRGISSGLIDRVNKQPVIYLFGVPRWMWRKALLALWNIAKASLSGNKKPANSFCEELRCWDLLGFFYGKHFYSFKRTDAG